MMEQAQGKYYELLKKSSSFPLMLKTQHLVELSNNLKTILKKSYSVHSEFPTYFLITSQNLNETYPFYYSSFSWLPCQYNSIWFLLSKVRRIVSV